MEKQIVWESWNVKEHDMLDDSKEQDEPLDLQEMDEMNNIPIFIAQQKTITTPFGVFDVSSPFLPSSRWDCWIGHTNFDITKSIVEILNEAHGVDSLVVMGRYSFCIGIPHHLFSSSEVKAAIEVQLKSYNQNSIELNENVPIIKEILNNPYWSILVKNGGQIESYAVSQENNEDYQKQIQQLEILREKNGGEIFCSESEQV